MTDPQQAARIAAMRARRGQTPVEIPTSATATPAAPVRQTTMVAATATWAPPAIAAPTAWWSIAAGDCVRNCRRNARSSLASSTLPSSRAQLAAKASEQPHSSARSNPITRPSRRRRTAPRR